MGSEGVQIEIPSALQFVFGRVLLLTTAATQRLMMRVIPIYLAGKPLVPQVGSVDLHS